ncbi:MAG: hypothetical protein OEU36_22530, partial [Gammaproteobacteria bacterium]|nr:hypothetical protein [Gammaproteobacteria bacterium]
MRNQNPVQVTVVCVIALLVCACGPASESTESPKPAESIESTSLEQQVSGLWLYTGLTTSDGTDMPLTGIFLFKDGVFLQQAVFDGGTFGEAGSMAHAGPYRPEPATGSIHLVAEQ